MMALAEPSKQVGYLSHGSTRRLAAILAADVRAIRV